MNIIIITSSIPDRHPPSPNPQGQLKMKVCSKAKGNLHTGLEVVTFDTQTWTSRLNKENERGWLNGMGKGEDTGRIMFL